jgi:hypothetical protein
LILVLAFLFVFLWLYSGKDKPTHISEGEILKSPPQSVPPEVVAPVIEEINARNRDIKAVIYMRIKLRLKDGMFTIRLAGSLDYEKPRNFRSELWHGRSKELDLGSNDKYFWFWSKRMDPPAVFYCKHEDVSKSRLRPVFYPAWIIESLGVDEISVKDAQIDMTDRYCKITKRRGALRKTTLIDRHKKVIVGHYLHDQDRLLVSSEVLDFSSFDGLMFPTKIKVVWHEENVTLHWDLENPGYRLMGYPPMFKNWEVPKGDLMIDMSEY